MRLPELLIICLLFGGIALPSGPVHAHVRVIPKVFSHTHHYWSWRVDGGWLRAVKNTPIGKPKKGQVVDSVPVVEAETTPVGEAATEETATQAPTDAVVTQPAVQANPFTGVTLYVDPSSDAAKQVIEWQTARPEDALLMTRIASQSSAKWFGNWNSDIQRSVDRAVTAQTAAGALPVFVAYNIPDRGCSLGAGAASHQEYLTWITAFAEGIRDRQVVVILEPDALSQTNCVTTERLATMQAAVRILSAKPQVSVYIDAGHSDWIAADEMARRLTAAGVDAARGFALNVSNHHTTSDLLAYGETLSALVGGKHFVLDVGRNGAGSNGEHCNAPGAALGQNPTSETGNALADAFLWVKPPGESDGTCNGGLPSGGWMPEYALELVRNAR